MIDLDQIRHLREDVFNTHRSWKQGIYTRDLVANGKWSTIWDDDHAEASDPLVENVYIEALEDKTMTAGSIMPKILAGATRGTRQDRGERNAQKRRRAFIGYWRRSRIEDHLEQYYYDLLHTGAVYLQPWCDFYDRDGNEIPEPDRMIRIQRINPRYVFPVSHHTLGRLTSVLISKVRSIADLRQEYGPNHPGLNDLEDWTMRHQAGRALEKVEELWYFDEDEWSVAFCDPGGAGANRHQYVVPQPRYQTAAGGGPMFVWGRAPEKHRLTRCPVAEARVTSHDGQYRSPLEPVIPHLRVAQNIMARVLDDMLEHVYAPVIIENIANVEEFGPGAVLEGTGEGPGRVEYARPPGNYEATQKIIQKLVEARRQARHPEQRQGDPGASIVSDKGLRTLQGSFNAELASAQRKMARVLQDVNELAAEFDEVWAPGEKSIDGTEDGKVFQEKYDPVVLFDGDYRNTVSYGSTIGLDDNAAMLRQSAMLNFGVLSKRSFARTSGAVEDPLHEERERGIEEVLLIGQGLLAAQAQAGSPQAWQAIADYYDAVDSDQTTHRAALIEAVKKITAPQPTTGPAAAPPDIGDPVRAARSLASGGIPGTAPGQPPVATDNLLNSLPPQISRILTETGPGGTAA